MKRVEICNYIDEAIMKMEADEFSAGADVGIDGFLDGGADNVGEIWACFVVKVVGELS